MKYELYRYSNGINGTDDCVEGFETLEEAGRALIEARRRTGELGLSDMWTVRDSSGKNVWVQAYWAAQ